MSIKDKILAALESAHLWVSANPYRCIAAGFGAGLLVTWII